MDETQDIADQETIIKSTAGTMYAGLSFPALGVEYHPLMRFTQLVPIRYVQADHDNTWFMSTA